MSANDDGSSSPCKRRRNATNVNEYFKEEKGRNVVHIQIVTRVIL